jgi:preprotein translocase subunit SecD
MSQNLKGRTAFIVALLVVFCYGIVGIPHGLGPAALKQALTDRIKLGLDLKGGTHLVLQVHVLDAVVSTSDRDVERLQDDLQKAGIAGVTVGKLDPARPEVITVSGVPAAKVSDARTLMEGSD